MKIDQKWLIEKDACDPGIRWFRSQKLKDPIEIIQHFRNTKNRLDWASWLLTRIFSKRQCVQYAIFAAEQALHIFEKQFLNDDRPRKAIEEAKAYLKYPFITSTAADAAYAAAAYAADAADATAYAADATAYAADAADAADAAYAAAAYAADAADAFKDNKIKLQITILNYGLELLEVRDET